jgi:hypothetical protein
VGGLRAPAAFVAIAVMGSVACGGLLGLEDPTVLDGGVDGSATGDGSSGLDGGPSRDGGGDASERDGGSVDPDACAPAPGNLLANNNADFELGCTAWSTADGGTAGFGGTLDASTQAHCGRMACAVCPDLNVFTGVHTDVTIPAFQGEQYQLRAFVQAIGSAPFVVVGRLGLEEGLGVLDGKPLVVASGGYTPYLAALEVPADSTVTDVEMLLEPPADGGCVLLDDVALVRVRDAGAD